MDTLNMRLFDARTDSVPVLACIGTCDPEVGDDNFAAAYRGTMNAFERSELDVFCKAALEGASKPLDTRELALPVTVAREWNADDKRPRISIAHEVTLMLTRYLRRGEVREEESREGSDGVGHGAGLSTKMLWRLAGL